jgi:hypothetical protein
MTRLSVSEELESAADRIADMSRAESSSVALH